MNAPSDWWRTFFTGLAVDLWLRATPEAMTCGEADFIQKMLAVTPPAKLLDVPCGGGRHSVALAERGYQMTGVDISPAFLKSAREKSAEKSGAIRWEERDMRDLPWVEEFDGAYSFGNSFGYLSDDGNAAFLKAVARSLKPGARFVIDTGSILEVLLPSLQERTWMQIGDILFLPDRRYDLATGRLEVVYTFIRAGQIETKGTSTRLYTFREICRLVEDAGFKDLQSYASLSQEPFQFGSKRLLLGEAKA